MLNFIASHFLQLMLLVAFMIAIVTQLFKKGIIISQVSTFVFLILIVLSAFFLQKNAELSGGAFAFYILIILTIPMLLVNYISFYVISSFKDRFFKK